MIQTRFFFLLVSFSFFQFLSAQTKKDSVYVPTALIEMFSSEGCSSCPLGSQFMEKIIQIADSNDQPVFVIDYHVQIWDHATFKDAYADSMWTKRQRTYMDKTNQPALFTPMLVINGKHNLPAGDKKEVGRTLSNIMTKASPHSLEIGGKPIPDSSLLRVNYRAEGNLDSTQMVFVLAETEIVHKVTGGENAGQTLKHHHVARKLLTTDLKSKIGSFDFPIDKGTDLSKYIMVVFVQHKRTWHVYAANQLYFK